MGTTATIERQRALAWIVRQLSWERTLEVLRVNNETTETTERTETGEQAAA
jgi:hypothetical protein